MFLPPIVPLLLILGLSAASAGPPREAEALHLGRWSAWLDSPGGALRFGLTLEKSEGGIAAVFVNGAEEIAAPRASWEAGELTIDIAHYDARIIARGSPDGTRLDGTWEKHRGPDRSARLAFHALALPTGILPRPPLAEALRAQIAGRWRVTFSAAATPAVGIFEARADGDLIGTFLTDLGDYRYLAGQLDPGARRLELSCFDGAHAFLFHAQLLADGSLAGEFYSGDSWHESWTAVRDPAAALPDPFGLTRWTGAVPLEELVFPDLSGTPRSLADPRYAGKARLLVLFGSWCPNCHDEAPFLAKLDRRFRPRGLAILGLAFEHGGAPERAVRQLERFKRRHGIAFPLLIAGPADKAEASRSFPLLDRLRAYPTTVFLHGDGRVRAVHTGFSGPATGAAHERLKQRFEDLIEELLAEGDDAKR